MLFTYIAAVVDKSGQVSTFGGINDGVLINTEHVAAFDALLLVSLFSHVSDDLKRKRLIYNHYCPWKTPRMS